MSLGVGTCRSCGYVVAYDARVCPLCGTANPAGSPGNSIWWRLTKLLLIGGLLFATTAWWPIFVPRLRELAAQSVRKPDNRKLTIVTAAVKKLFTGVDAAMGTLRK